MLSDDASVLTRRAGAPRLIDWTGERCVPWVSDLQVFYEHLHRYLWAAPIVAGRRVLDLASGEGYGTAILARTASSVVGVEIDERSVEHSRLNYLSDRVSFAVADAHDLSTFEDGAFEAVVAFEMIEHVDDQQRVLDEIRRVLEPDGILIISTPDREIYAQTSPDNPFHTHEFSREELAELLRARFARIAMFGQRAITGSALAALDDQRAGHAQRLFVERADDEWRIAGGLPPVYLLAVASNAELPAAPSDSILGDVGLSLVSQTKARCTALEAQLNQKVTELVVASRDLTAATRNQERLLAELEHWRTLSDRFEQERDSLAAELGRRPVRAALRVANALRPR
jgi:O-antigen biosynthesis protein